MLDSLGALVITFFAMSFISIIGVILLFFLKNEKVKKGLLYFLGLWGLVIAYCNIQTVVTYSTAGLLIAGGLGVLAIAGVLISLLGKGENRFKIAQILVTISVFAGMIDTFLI